MRNRSGLISITDHFKIGHRYTALVRLIVDFSVTMNRNVKSGRQGVYDGRPYTVKTAGYFISASVKFTAGVENGHDDFNRRAAHLLLDTDRNSAPVILNGNAVIFFNLDVNICTITGQGLVNTVVDDFPHQMVKAFAVS